MTAIDALAVAQDAAQARVWELDAAEHSMERGIVSPLVDVIDHTRRVLLPTASAHYRAEKVGVLVDAALATQAAAFAALAGTGAPDRVHDRLDALARELADVQARIRAAMWEVST